MIRKPEDLSALKKKSVHCSIVYMKSDGKKISAENIYWCFLLKSFFFAQKMTIALAFAMMSN